MNSSKPTLSPSEKAGLVDYFLIYEKHLSRLNAVLMENLPQLPFLSKVVMAIDPRQLEEQNNASLALMRRAIIDDEWGPLAANQEKQGAQYAGMGVPFHEWFELITTFQRVLLPFMVTELGKEPTKLADAITGMSIYINFAMSKIGDAYLRTKEKIIASQQMSIEELSTPVLLIGPRLLLVPLIGVLDTERARKMTEQLLYAVRSHRAKAVVIDITGVPAVDSKVANHLFQTVAAARLMGARSVVTGLTADVAQALVALGIDVERLTTAGDLREGLEEAERFLHHNALITKSTASP